MTDGFVRKKVESLTLGEKLKKLRQQYRMSYAEIAKATRIQAKYLEYLENGEYEKLPAEVYVKGFLKSYARHLGLEDEAFLKLYEKEKHIRENLGQETVASTAVRYPAMNVWIITPRTVFIILLVLVLGGTFTYLFTEFRSFVAEPRLLITEPLSGSTLSESVTTLRGQTDPGTVVTANGEPVFVTDTGEFGEEVTLQQGMNRIVVRATNRFEKMKEVTVTLESRLETNPVVLPVEPSSSSFTFAIRAVEEAVDVTLASGETVLYSGTLLPGKEQRFSELTESVRLSTDDAKHTETSLDGTPFTPIGQEATPISGKVFTREGR